MSKYKREVSFFDVVNGLDIRVSSNEELALFDFDYSYYQTVRKALVLKYDSEDDIWGLL